MNILLNTFIDNKLYNYPLGRTFEWRTDIVEMDSGTEVANQLLEQPKRHWSLPYNNLTGDEIAKLVELFNRAKGRYLSFLFEDPEDSECDFTECSITAIAAQTDFQLIKTYYPGEAESWDEDKKDIQPGTICQPTVKIDGVVQVEDTDYTLDDTTGIVIFSGAPGAGAVITAHYRFYFRVRFDIDAYTDSSNVKNIWSAGNIDIMEVLD